jgi:[ribosomal protein S5]-alanine N-acetyltransferase
MPTLALATERLDLVPLGADALDALVAEDGARLQALTGAIFPEPAIAPPLLADALPFIRDRLRDRPEELGWWVWLFVRRDTGESVGSAGLTGFPDVDGMVVIGWSTYPAHQNRGYAAEGVRELVEWALAQPDVRLVRATIPPDNAPSIRVAEKAGFEAAGRMPDEEFGELLVYDRAAGERG